MGNVIPTVFAHSAAEFKKRFARLVKISSAIQIDFMDSVFVPARSMPLSVVPNLRRYKARFEAHLMVANPERWIAGCREKGFKKVIFHVEALKSKEEGIRITKEIQKQKMKAMIALHADTPLEKINPFLNNVDGVLVMGIHAGKEHLPLAPNTARRVATIKKKMPKLWVQVDGGVNAGNVGRLAEAGVDAVNSGGFIADAQNPEEALRLLGEKFREGKR